MNLEQLIQSIGFPAVCVLGMAMFIPKLIDKFMTVVEDNMKSMREDDKVAQDRLYDELKYSREVNAELLSTNKDISETNRMLVTELRKEVSNIGAEVSNIGEKIDSLLTSDK